MDPVRISLACSASQIAISKDNCCVEGDNLHACSTIRNHIISLFTNHTNSKIHFSPLQKKSLNFGSNGGGVEFDTNGNIESVGKIRCS